MKKSSSEIALLAFFKSDVTDWPFVCGANTTLHAEVDGECGHLDVA
jgi:hypothetical protein